MKQVLAVDCWGVIFRPPFGVPVPGAIESLRKLASSGAFSKIYIVSKVDPISQYLTLFNFWRHDFWKRTGIPRENIFFCRKYEQKALIAEKLGITHFIDDRLPAFRTMEEAIHLYAFNPRKKDIKKYPEVMEKAKTVNSWEELMPLLEIPLQILLEAIL